MQSIIHAFVRRYINGYQRLSTAISGAINGAVNGYQRLSTAISGYQRHHAVVQGIQNLILDRLDHVGVDADTHQ